jgi:enoyl-CoA hydratase/carnithine racemase
MGLVSRVAAVGALADATASFAAAVATRNRSPLAHAKMAAYTAERMTFEESLLNDLVVAARQNTSARPFDNVNAFLADRHRTAAPAGGGE